MTKENTRPPLSSKLNSSEFRDFYWEKKELITFCSKVGIPTPGGKIEIVERIVYFLETGKVKEASARVVKGPKDSSGTITKDTPVINYKNDAVTRDFFVSVCGKSFKFNGYLREFAKETNDGSLTYSDLAEGYKKSLTEKKKPIDGQFEYNRFFREFFENETNATRDDCISAWKLVRSVSGEANYQHYLELLKN